MHTRLTAVLAAGFVALTPAIAVAKPVHTVRQAERAFSKKVTRTLHVPRHRARCLKADYTPARYDCAESLGGIFVEGYVKGSGYARITGGVG